jgi:hypothetical protein
LSTRIYFSYEDLWINIEKKWLVDYVLTGTFTQYCFWGILVRIYSIYTSLHLEYWFFDARVNLRTYRHWFTCLHLRNLLLALLSLPIPVLFELFADWTLTTRGQSIWHVWHAWGVTSILLQTFRIKTNDCSLFFNLEI